MGSVDKRVSLSVPVLRVRSVDPNPTMVVGAVSRGDPRTAALILLGALVLAVIWWWLTTNDV